MMARVKWAMTNIIIINCRNNLPILTNSKTDPMKLFTNPMI